MQEWPCPLSFSLTCLKLKSFCHCKAPANHIYTRSHLYRNKSFSHWWEVRNFVFSTLACCELQGFCSSFMGNDQNWSDWSFDCIDVLKQHKVGRLGKRRKNNHRLFVSCQFVTRKVPLGGSDTLHKMSHIYERKGSQNSHQPWKMFGICCFVPIIKHIP